MHITISPDISLRNRFFQQLPSGSGSRPLQVCCPNLSNYKYTPERFQGPLLLGHRPAPLLPHTTTFWNIYMITDVNSFHSQPASPAGVQAAPVPDLIPIWVKE